MTDKNAVDFDAMCDPASPRKVTFEDITAASFRIQSGIVKTPCVRSHLHRFTGMDIYLKCEFQQYTGSFKERGARNAIINLEPEAKKNGTVAASLGNHSQGMSYHGYLLKVPTTVVMPVVAPLMKVEKCRAFGANVVLFGQNMTEAKFHALKLAKEKNLTYINGYDHPDILAGQGTIGLEILDQLPDVQAVIVPVGGGGLLAGILIAIKRLKPDCLVYGVETEKCASMALSLQKGTPTFFDVSRTMADGLAVSNVGVNAFFNIKPLIDKMVVVTEDWTARGILRIVELEKYVLEGGGAVAVAAVISGLVDELKGKKVVCVCSGGNIDTTILSVCLQRGLVQESRLTKFKLNISNSPGSLSKLCGMLGEMGILIKDMFFEHGFLQGNIFFVRIKVICETKGPEHVQELKTKLAANYEDCFFLKENQQTSANGARYSLTDSLEKVSAITGQKSPKK